ncbi:uncharacterized protein LOC116165491 [Photinus pyralis]|uniref:uncharacterized protein LOC116165491 n=1 Tax=Photinus pyralis TaxID=7054 RepID=UPI001266EBD1|nr:uncharacterized protein LOC116165491 [Photinus pyralis]
MDKELIPPGMSNSDIFCMQRMMDMFINENRRRDELFVQIIERFTPQNADSNQGLPIANTAASVHVIPDISRVISSFDGDRDIPNAERWLLAVETSAKLNNWPDNFTVETARAHLKGAAIHWFEAKIELIHTWDEFKLQFKQTFVVTEGLAERWDRMRARKQQRTESVISYFYEKVGLCNKLQLQLAEIKDEVLSGLYSKSIASNLSVKRYFDLDSLLKDILVIERVKGTRSDELESYRVRASGNVRSTSKGCFTCGLSGHIASQCRREKLVCFECQQPGHYSSSCPNGGKQRDTRSRPQQNDVGGRSSQRDNTIRKRVNVISKNMQRSTDVTKDAGEKLTRCIVLNDNSKRFHSEMQPLYGFGNEKPVLYCIGKIHAKITIDNVSGEAVEFSYVQVKLVTYSVNIHCVAYIQTAYVKKGNRFVFGYAFAEPFKDLDVRSITRANLKISMEDIIPPYARKTMGFCCATTEGKKAQIFRVYNACDKEIHCKRGQIIPSSNIRDHRLIRKLPITQDMLNVDPEISVDQRNDLYELVMQFRDCFALTLDELGCTTVTTMDIVDTNVPVRCNPYKVNEEDRQTIKKLVDELKMCGLVVETTSLYASPVLLVRKKNGDPRLVVDYRKLNAQTIKSNYPIPSMDEQFQYLSGNKIFASLDLANGYLQVPLTEEAARKTAFITPDTTGEFRRMIFGLTNAPYEFVRLMNVVLGPLKNKVCCCYLDDVIIPVRDWDELLKRTRLVFEAFRSAGLTLNINKCQCINN